MAIFKNTTINDTGYFGLPSGSKDQRPSTPSTGSIRYNGTDNVVEVYNGTGWQSWNVTTGPTIVTTNLVLWLDPTDSNSYAGSGTTVTNLGSGPDASLIGGAGFNSSGKYWTLDGSNDYISSTDDGSYDVGSSDDITIIVWIYVSTSSQYAHFMAWDQQTTAAFKAAPSAYSHQIYWYTPAYSTYDNLSSTFSYSMNTWTQLAIIRRSGVWEAYKNGTYVGNDSDSNDTASFSCTNLNMGWGYGSEWTAQYRGPILLYKGNALTAQQITDNYDYYKTTYGLT